MAMNWAILDPQSVKVELPDFAGSINRGMALGRNLGEYAGMQALGRQVAQDAQGTELGSSIGALAAYNPEKALTMLENRNVLSDKFGNAERIAQMRRQTGIDSPEKEAIADELANNTNAHQSVMNRAISATRSNAKDEEISSILAEAYKLEALDREIKAKASYAGIPVGSVNAIGVRKSANDVLNEMGRQDIALRTATAQEQLANASLANVGLQRKKLEAETKTATETAEGGTADQRKAAGFIGSMVSGNDGLTASGRPSVLTVVQGKMFAGSTPFDLAARQFINAVLRRESGAAITEGDYSTVGPQYIPGPTDSDAVLESKAKARAERIEAMKSEAGTAYKAPTARKYKVAGE